MSNVAENNTYSSLDDLLRLRGNNEVNIINSDIDCSVDCIKIDDYYSYRVPMEFNKDVDTIESIVSDQNYTIVSNDGCIYDSAIDQKFIVLPFVAILCHQLTINFKNKPSMLNIKYGQYDSYTRRKIAQTMHVSKNWVCVSGMIGRPVYKSIHMDERLIKTFTSHL